MYNTKLSSYTLADIDALMTISPVFKRLSESLRQHIYNLVQEDIYKYYSEDTRVILLPPTTVVDNKLTYTPSEVQNIHIYELRQEDLENLRGSLVTLKYVDDILKQHEVIRNLSETQRIKLYNLAQQSIANLRNGNEETDYTIGSIFYDKTIPIPVNLIVSPTISINLYIVDDFEFTTIVSPTCAISYTIASLEDSYAELTLTSDCSFTYIVSGGPSTTRMLETTIEPVITFTITAHTLTSTTLLTQGSVAISYEVTGP